MKNDSEVTISKKFNFVWISLIKGGSRHKNWCTSRVLGFLIRYFSNYYTLHRSDLAARAAPLDPRLFLGKNTVLDLYGTRTDVKSSKREKKVETLDFEPYSVQIHPL